jgi:hypothetical protein
LLFLFFRVFGFPRASAFLPARGADFRDSVALVYISAGNKFIRNPCDRVAVVGARHDFFAGYAALHFFRYIRAQQVYEGGFLLDVELVYDFFVYRQDVHFSSPSWYS